MKELIIKVITDNLNSEQANNSEMNMLDYEIKELANVIADEVLEVIMHIGNHI